MAAISPMAIVPATPTARLRAIGPLAENGMVMVITGLAAAGQASRRTAADAGRGPAATAAAARNLPDNMSDRSS